VFENGLRDAGRPFIICCRLDNLCLALGFHIHCRLMMYRVRIRTPSAPLTRVLEPLDLFTSTWTLRQLHVLSVYDASLASSTQPKSITHSLAQSILSVAPKTTANSLYASPKGELLDRCVIYSFLEAMNDNAGEYMIILRVYDSTFADSPRCSFLFRARNYHAWSCIARMQQAGVACCCKMPATCMAHVLETSNMAYNAFCLKYENSSGRCPLT